MPDTSWNAESAVRDFVRQAVPLLNAAARTSADSWEIEKHWQRGADGHFRERSSQRPRLWRVLTEYQSVPEHAGVLQAVKADPLIGPHLDRLVGTVFSATRIEANNVLWAMLHAMVNEDGTFNFTDERFDSEWQEILQFCRAERFIVKTVAPLPYLTVTSLPLHLNGETGDRSPY